MRPGWSRSSFQEGLELSGPRRLEIELDDDVLVVIDWVSDALGDDACAASRFLEAAEGAEPGVQIADRMFDMEGGHHSSFVSCAG